MLRRKQARVALSLAAETDPSHSWTSHLTRINAPAIHSYTSSTYIHSPPPWMISPNQRRYSNNTSDSNGADAIRRVVDANALTCSMCPSVCVLVRLPRGCCEKESSRGECIDDQQRRCDAMHRFTRCRVDSMTGRSHYLHLLYVHR